MSVLSAPQPVLELHTGLLRTDVHGGDDGRFSWVRRVGETAPQPFSTVGSQVLTALRSIPAHRSIRLTPGEGGARLRRYDVAGHCTVAGQVSSGAVTDDLPKLLHGVGELLRHLHSAPITADTGHDSDVGSGGLGRSRGVVRVADWLHGRARQFWAAHFAAELRDHLGPAGWAALHDALDMARTTTDPVLSHGALSLGAVVPASRGGRADLLIGEDVCAAAWFVDPGWLIGEIAELRWQFGNGVTDWPAALGAFEAGYGRDLDERCQQVAVLRIALHLHDYLAYVSPDPRELRRYAGLLVALIRS